MRNHLRKLSCLMSGLLGLWGAPATAFVFSDDFTSTNPNLVVGWTDVRGIGTIDDSPPTHVILDGAAMIRNNGGKIDPSAGGRLTWKVDYDPSPDNRQSQYLTFVGPQDLSWPTAPHPGTLVYWHNIDHAGCQSALFMSPDVPAEGFGGIRFSSACPVTSHEGTLSWSSAGVRVTTSQGVDSGVIPWGQLDFTQQSIAALPELAVMALSGNTVFPVQFDYALIEGPPDPAPLLVELLAAVVDLDPRRRGPERAVRIAQRALERMTNRGDRFAIVSLNRFIRRIGRLSARGRIDAIVAADLVAQAQAIVDAIRAKTGACVDEPLPPGVPANGECVNVASGTPCDFLGGGPGSGICANHDCVEVVAPADCATAPNFTVCSPGPTREYQFCHEGICGNPGAGANRNWCDFIGTTFCEARSECHITSLCDPSTLGCPFVPKVGCPTCDTGTTTGLVCRVEDECQQP